MAWTRPGREEWEVGMVVEMRRRMLAVVTACLPSSAACQLSPTLPDVRPPCPLGYLLAMVVGIERALKLPELGKVSSWKVVASCISFQQGRVWSKGLHFPDSLRQAMWFSSNQWSESKETSLSLFLTTGPDSKKGAFLGSSPHPVPTPAQD